MSTLMQQRRDTSANWASANPILLPGEIGWDTDVENFKMGNGVTAWNALAFYAGSGVTINDTVPSVSEVFSSQHVQDLHNVQAIAIANLATAQAQILNDDITVITTTNQPLSFSVNIDSTDTNVMTLDATSDTFTFLQNASYNFTSAIQLASSTGQTRTITFEVIDVSDNSVLATQTATLDVASGSDIVVNTVTLLTIGKNAFPNAPVTASIRVRASGTGYTVTGFTSILASSSSYDVSADASGITFTPAGSIEATNVQTAIQEIDSEKVDKVTGKALSTNDFTDTLKTLLETKKVKDVTLDALNNRAVITYTDNTTANLNVNDIVTDVNVTGATLDATTNVLTLTSTSGGADVIVDLSTFVNSDEIMNYYTKDETDAIHESLATTSVGQSVSYFLGDTIVSGGNYDLTTYPDGDVETVISTTAVNANTSYFMERYISDPVGGTTIDGGIWVFRTYASVNSATGISEIVCRINKRTAKTGTITTTGTGLTRTVTSTVPIFVAGDADASILNASLIETPTETFWISTYVSATQVTITLSSDTYVNETAVPFYMYYKLFEASTGEINATVATLYETNSIQPEFVILPEDSILIAYFARTTSTNKTIRIYKGGAEHYSHIVTPLVYRHNSLKGLNDGDYQHLTTAQLATVAAITAYGKSLVDDVDASAARTTLGISATNTPSTAVGNIVATNVQAALAELDTEKANQSTTYTKTEIDTITGNINSALDTINGVVI